jgi:undecaprenyl-diphosphatase
LASEVGEGETSQFDQAVLLVAQSVRASHTWIAEVMRDLSGLGSTVVLSLITLSTVSYLAIFREKRTALLLACAVTSGTLLVSLFKANFGRARPESRFAEFVVSGGSFPSGHASMSAVVFLTLGALIASARTNRVEQRFILLVAALMTILVGVSRVVLGVHFATDVLGGWIFGASWAIAWLLFAHWLAIHFRYTTLFRQ